MPIASYNPCVRAATVPIGLTVMSSLCAGLQSLRACSQPLHVTASPQSYRLVNNDWVPDASVLTKYIDSMCDADLPTASVRHRSRPAVAPWWCIAGPAAARRSGSASRATTPTRRATTCSGSTPGSASRATTRTTASCSQVAPRRRTRRHTRRGAVVGIAATRPASTASPAAAGSAAWRARAPAAIATMVRSGSPGARAILRGWAQ